MKKNHDVIYQAHCIIDSYVKRTKMQNAHSAYSKFSDDKKRKPQNTSPTPLIVLALIFTILCVVNIIMWFSF